MSSDLNIIFAATEDALADAFETESEALESVSVFRGSIFDLECDAMISPANSFGFMDGGIDAWFCWRFGDKIQDSVRLAILKFWQGELPIGCAEIVETGDESVPFVISAPTMRVPMYLGDESINPYLAMRAAIMLCRNGVFKDGKHQGARVNEHVKTIAIPGLGTGVGAVPFELAAFQMCEAIRLHRSGKHFLPKSWAEAVENQLGLLKQESRNLQYKTSK